MEKILLGADPEEPVGSPSFTDLEPDIERGKGI